MSWNIDTGKRKLKLWRNKELVPVFYSNLLDTFLELFPVNIVNIVNKKLSFTGIIIRNYTLIK